MTKLITNINKYIIIPYIYICTCATERKMKQTKLEL